MSIVSINNPHRREVFYLNKTNFIAIITATTKITLAVISTQNQNIFLFLFFTYLFYFF